MIIMCFKKTLYKLVSSDQFYQLISPILDCYVKINKSNQTTCDIHRYLDSDSFVLTTLFN